MSYFPQLAEAFSELLASVANDRVFVVGHARPDGDCIGSQVAMSRLLRSQGVDTLCLNADPIPDALSFLLGASEVEPLKKRVLDGRSLLFVDCADWTRVGSKESEIIENENFLGNIDHHISNTEFAHLNIVESTAAATCEIVAGLAFDFGWEVDPITAQALFTGIMTDTGRFGYAATSSRVFSLCARLVDCGAKPQITAQSLYENEPFSRLKLLEKFLGTLRVELDGQLGLGEIRYQDFLDTGASYEHTEGFVDYTRAIQGAKIGLYLEQRKSMSKASLRAENADFRVDLIAKQFGGGGHACAAAFSSDESLEALQPRVIAAIDERLKQVNSPSE